LPQSTNYTTNYILTLRFIPNRTWLALGPGWAVLAGGLAANGLALATDLLLKLGLLWLLADPLLGTVWELLTQRAVWLRLKRPQPPPAVHLKPVLPYLSKDSAGYRLLVFWTHVSTLPNGEGYSLFIAVLLALFMASLLGWVVVLYALISLFLAILIREREGGFFWRSMALFLLPYLMGLFVMNRIGLYAILFGGAYWCVYFGLLWLGTGQMKGARLVIMGQAVTALLLFSLSAPLMATPVALAAIFSILLRSQAQTACDPDRAAAWYVKYLTPFLWLGLFISAIAVGSR